MTRSKWLVLLLLAVLAYGYIPNLIGHIERTFDPFTFNDDARILIWPFFRDADPSLFLNDPFVNYFLAGLPEGYRGLFHVFGRMGLAGVASEVLPYVLLLVTLGYLAASSYRVGGQPGAFLAVVLLLGGASVQDRLGGGLPRSFAFPLVAAATYALVRGRAGYLALLTVLGAAFYPVVAALVGLSLFFLLAFPARLRGDTEHSDLKKRAALLFATFLFIVGLLVPTVLRLRPYGETITPKMLVEYPEAGPGGRLGPEQQAPFPPWYKNAGFHVKQSLLGQGEPLVGSFTSAFRTTETKKNVLVGSVLLAAFLSLVGQSYYQRFVAPEILRLLPLFLAMIVGYVLSSLVTPALFLPERYAQYSAPLLAILLLAAGFGKKEVSRDPLGNLGAGALPPRTRFSRWRSVGPWVLTGLASVLLGGRGSSWLGIEVWVPPEERVIYLELGRLPKDSLIAGFPAGPLENVPYLSKRRVLTNYQLEMPFHRGFSDATRERLKCLFTAYYATDRAALEVLAQRFGVTHLLLDPAHYVGNAPSYYRPFDVEVRQKFEGARPRDWLLEWAKNPAVGRRIGRLYLVNLQQLLALSGGNP